MKRRTVEIPQFLKYSLKVHGLTSRQFLILLLGAGVSASCWQSFEIAQRTLAIGCIIVTLVVALATAFVRVAGRPLEEWITVILMWSLQPEWLRGKAFQRAFRPIKAIGEDGIVEMQRGGGYLALLAVEGYSIAQDDQEIFLEAFAGFLSGLSFPLAIHIRMRYSHPTSTNVPDAALPSTQRRLQAHYLSFLSEQIRQRPPKSLTCYAIVAARKRDQCLDYTKAALVGLTQAQLSCRLLSSKEITAFYRESLGGTAQEAVAARLAMKTVRFETATTQTYRAGLVVSGFPGSLPVDVLSTFLQQQEEPYDLCMYVQPIEDQQIASSLQRKAAQLGGAVLVAERQGHRKGGNSITRYALKEVERLREQLVLKQNHLFSTTVFVCVQATSRTKVSARMKRVRRHLRSLNVDVVPLHFQHHLAIASFYGQNLLASYAHLLPTDAVAALYPFVRIPTLGEGVLLGATQQGDLVSLDFDTKMNQNLAVLGTPGAGKSFFFKTLSSRLAVERSISLIDVEGEYRKWAEAVGARQVIFSADSLVFNPFSLWQSHSLREKIGFIVGFIALLVGIQGELLPHDKALVVEAAMQAYTSYGITDDPATYGRTAPVMRDFMGCLRQIDPASDITYRLEMYVHLFPQQAREVEEERETEHQVYNLHDLPEQLRAPTMYLIIERLSSLLYENSTGRKHLVIVDEAWFLLKFGLGASFLNEFARRARKYSVGLWVGTQQVQDLLAEQEGNFKGLLDLCETKVLFRQEIDLETLLKLHSSEEKFLRSAGRGEALYITSQERFTLKVLASERESIFARGANT